MLLVCKEAKAAVKIEEAKARAEEAKVPARIEEAKARAEEAKARNKLKAEELSDARKKIDKLKFKWAEESQRRSDLARTLESERITAQNVLADEVRAKEDAERRLDDEVNARELAEKRNKRTNSKLFFY